MTTALPPAGGSASGPSSSGLADVIDTILDKGLVIDAYVRLSLVGIELITIDARIVIASVDTYLRFAQAANRLQISTNEPKGLADLVQSVKSGGSNSKTQGVLEAASEKLGDFLSQSQQPQRHKVKRVSSRRGAT
jgi:hypothetical protein